ncbi:MAG: holin [Christensenellales bacterium]
MNMKTNFKLWMRAAGVRALKTCAQSAIAMIGTSVVLADVNWIMVVSATLLSGVLSLLTSVAGLPEMKTTEGE